MKRWDVVGWFLVLTMVIAACNAVGSAYGQNLVHMGMMTFDQSSITIKKGETMTLINDATAVHIVENGRWDANGVERPERGPGAPKVDVQIGGNSSATIGPFNAPGTFWLYCAIHPGMNLTVIVS